VKIEIADLAIQFPGMTSPLLSIPSQRLPQGTRLLIRGPSGTGKTSLLHILAGLMDPHRGRVAVDGQDLSHLSESQRCAWRRRSLGLVFQRLNLLGHLTAAENVLLASPDSSLDRSKALEALDSLGVADLADQLAYNLSLGEQQRVAVARVIARTPKLILADEPTSSLDDPNAQLVIASLLEAVGPEGTLLVATHDDRIAEHFQKVWTLERGKSL
jgi:putative ABC transport system ATP-binding protein